MLLSFWLLPIYKSCQRRRHISTTLDNAVLPTYLVSIVLCLVLLIFLVCVILFFMHYQDLSFLETFYMVFMTITTVGYGDYIPNYYTHVPVFIFFWFICSIPFAIFVALLTEINDLMATVWRKNLCAEKEIKFFSSYALADVLKMLAVHKLSWPPLLHLNHQTRWKHHKSCRSWSPEGTVDQLLPKLSLKIKINPQPQIRTKHQHQIKEDATPSFSGSLILNFYEKFMFPTKEAMIIHWTDQNIVLFSEAN